MILRFLADLVLTGHVAFVLFVVAGGLLGLRWPRAAWVHLPCAAWGAWVEIAGWVCPLTPLEVHLRQAAGEAGYAGGFLEHYVEPVLYPAGLTRGMQVGLGIAVLALNVAVYAVVWRRWRLCGEHMGRLTEDERDRLLNVFDAVSVAIPDRPRAEVEAELDEIRQARRAGGRQSGDGARSTSPSPPVPSRGTPRSGR